MRVTVRAIGACGLQGLLDLDVVRNVKASESPSVSRELAEGFFFVWLLELAAAGRTSVLAGTIVGTVAPPTGPQVGSWGPGCADTPAPAPS